MEKYKFDNLLALKAEVKMWKRALCKHDSKSLTKKIEAHLYKISKLEEEMIEYILNLPDPQLRDIIYMHCIEDLKWDYIAAKIGGGNTADSVRKIYSRFMKKL